MMASKTVLAFGLLLAVFLAISSEVAARNLAETSAEQFKAFAGTGETSVEDHDCYGYGCGRGGYGGGYGGRHGGGHGCRCCGYYHGHCKCCSAAEEAALVAAENKPQN